MRNRAVLSALIVSCLAVTVPAGAFNPFESGLGVPQAKAERTTKVAKLQFGPYRHLGTWIDMYDEEVWEAPETAVAGMQAHGVTTLFLETANWHKPKATPMFKPAKIGRFIDAAHTAGIKIVAWYVPGFKNLDKDKKRTLAALNFVSATGQTFDSFAMDIESTAVDNITKRNERMIELSRWLRRKVGPDYVLGGIVPDVQSAYWPGFRYDKVAKFYNVTMPMSYYSYRVEGKTAVYNYVLANIDQIRARAGDPALKMHPIGGIGGQTTRREARGYVQALLDRGVMGGSYYDYPITVQREWDELYNLRR